MDGFTLWFIAYTIGYHCGIPQLKTAGGGGTFVFSCGEIGDCPPCREAHPPWRVGPPLAVGECGRRVRPPPTAKGGLFPPFAVGGVREEGLK